MQKKRFFKSLFVAALGASLFFSCNKTDETLAGDTEDSTLVSDSSVTDEDSIVVDTTASDTTASMTMPDDWVVDIPDALSNREGVRSSRVIDTLINGADYYVMMTQFIGLAEEAAEYVDQIMKGISANNITGPTTITFLGEDSREKTLVVTENSEYDGETWGLYGMVKDQDGDTAIQVWWNTGVARGISIVSPANMNKNIVSELNALYKVYYSAVSSDYDEEMEISVITDMEDDRFSVDKMKMHVGSKDGIVKLYGNSNHPNAYLYDGMSSEAKNWAFIAKADRMKEIAVAATAIPPSSVSTNETIIEDYSLRNVVLDMIPLIRDSLDVPAFATDEMLLDQFTVNLGKPAYFSKEEGFISAGEDLPVIGGFTTDFSNLDGLKPYVPADVRDLKVSFK